MRENYLRAIENSVGTKLFRNFFAQDERSGKEEDILKDGARSCAAHTSSILYLYGFISSPRATVAGLIKDLEANGWQKVEKPSVGDVLVWEKKMINGNANEHCGFYVGEESGEGVAVSNDYVSRCPIKHHWTYGADKDGNPARRITAIYHLSE